MQALEGADELLISAATLAEAHARWGKGSHAARLNLGDCFAYVLAREHEAPLPFAGDGFSRTDAAGMPQARTEPAKRFSSLPCCRALPIGRSLYSAHDFRA